MCPLLALPIELHDVQSPEAIKACAVGNNVQVEQVFGCIVLEFAIFIEKNYSNYVN